MGDALINASNTDHLWTSETAPRGGRPKGALNKATLDAREFARSLIEDPVYLESLRCRILAGEAPQLEVLLHYYAFGRPKNQHPEPETPGLDRKEVERRILWLLNRVSGGQVANGNIAPQSGETCMAMQVPPSQIRTPQQMA